jgi:hypothetical protein
MKAMTARNINVGDAAVDGLLGGVAAGIVMAVYSFKEKDFG